ncbi:MlaD family protein [Nocardioides sp. AE5]|uniref:MlaD family protein n=1 Tax=Nocardioides sp. AE5 TaxID=2962573 RepID=UPI002882C3D8|nr:MlaD family protein [Nocardioides sp. AE5]MDT0201414.1 MlaD family protein [Nocardioides sp. AE5]
MTRRLPAIVLTVALGLFGASCSVLNAENIPVSTGVKDPYQVTVMFPDALNLANGAAVKIDGATVGRVNSVETENFKAKIVLDMDGRTPLPQDTIFRLRPTTALGELFVEVIRGESVTTMEPGTVVNDDMTRVAPTVEDGLAAASLLINGGSLSQIKTIITEVNTSMEGRTDTIKDFLHGADTLLATLNDSTGDLDAFLTALAEVSTMLNQREEQINEALDIAAPVAGVVRRNKDDITALLANLQGTTASVDGLVKATREDFRATLAELGPILETLQASKGKGKTMVIEAAKLAGQIDAAVPTEYLNLLLVMRLAGDFGLPTALTAAGGGN